MALMEATDCECEFDRGDEVDLFLFARTCEMCSFEWESLHCPHDGVQRGCPRCGWKNPGTRTPSQVIGIERVL